MPHGRLARNTQAPTLVISPRRHNITLSPMASYPSLRPRPSPSSDGCQIPPRDPSLLSAASMPLERCSTRSAATSGIQLNSGLPEQLLMQSISILRMLVLGPVLFPLALARLYLSPLPPSVPAPRTWPGLVGWLKTLSRKRRGSSRKPETTPRQASDPTGLAASRMLPRCEPMLQIPDRTWETPFDSGSLPSYSIPSEVEVSRKMS